MKRFSFGTTISFFVLALAVIGLLMFFGGPLKSAASAIFSKPASFAFARLESVRSFVRGLANARNLSRENESLKNENLSLISKVAKYEDLEQENGFLRASLDLAEEIDRGFVAATIYNLQLGPSGYRAMITKGANDGLSQDDVVATESGVLVGRLSEVGGRYSSLATVNDPSFSVTVKVLGSETTGIAVGAMDEGMHMDLVVQSDAIKEGDVIVSSGVDFFPAGLVVGVVSHVESIETQLFKKVKIKPSLDDLRLSRVLVIKSE